MKNLLVFITLLSSSQAWSEGKDNCEIVKVPQQQTYTDTHTHKITVSGRVLDTETMLLRGWLHNKSKGNSVLTGAIKGVEYAYFSMETAQEIMKKLREDSPEWCEIKK